MGELLELIVTASLELMGKSRWGWILAVFYLSLAALIWPFIYFLVQ